MQLMNIYWGAESGRVLVPTMAKTEAGFWLEMDPVEEAAAADANSIASALQRCASRATPVIPTPNRSELLEWVVGKAAKKRKPRDFENEYELLSVEHRSGDSYLIRKHHRSKEGRGYEPERDPRLILSSESSFLEIAAALQSIAD